ncbi:MAG: methyltransferase [Desulfomonilaceae bacterium]
MGRLAEGPLLAILIYVGAAICLISAIIFGADHPPEPLPTWRVAILIAVGSLAFFVFCISFFGLIAYLVFHPSLSRHGHIFAQVHAAQMLHPLTTAFVLGLFCICLYYDVALAWFVWLAILCLYVVHTVVLVRGVRAQYVTEDSSPGAKGLFVLILNLIFGAEIVTFAGGARPIAPWQLHELPEDTWIVDVRTKPEYYWNRMQGAENYPWGAGVLEAAQHHSVDRPVLVTCLSGHRSPAVAVYLRKLGFKHVYNLHWGLMYLMLLERNKKSIGPFSLTRPHRDPHRRGEDLRHISIGYLTLQFCILVIAPVEHWIRHPQVSNIQRIVALVIGIGGLILGWLSFRALGRNFRVFAAPRRSGTLVTTGVYSKVRHPMYVAAILIFAGYCLFFGSLISAPLWLAFSILYVIKSVREERILADHYPDYEDYMRRTWRFVPYVW